MGTYLHFVITRRKFVKNTPLSAALPQLYKMYRNLTHNIEIILAECKYLQRLNLWNTYYYCKE